MLIRQNSLDAVVGLPAQLFPTTGIPVCILVFDRAREAGGLRAHERDILFIDASRDVEPGKKLNRLRDSDVNKIVETYRTRAERERYSHKATLEEIEADGPDGHWEAANVFLYNPVAGQWSENYVDSSDGKMDRPNVGGYRDGKLEFYSIQAVGGRSMLVRGTWEIASPDRHSYTVARSIDGGRTWHTSFIARVSR